MRYRFLGLALAVGCSVAAACSRGPIDSTPGGSGNGGLGVPSTGSSNTTTTTTGGSTGSTAGGGCGPFDAGEPADNPVTVSWTLGDQMTCEAAQIVTMQVEISGFAAIQGVSCDQGNPADSSVTGYQFPGSFAPGNYAVDVRAYGSSQQTVLFEGLTSFTVEPLTPGTITSVTVPMTSGPTTSTLCGLPD